MNLEVFVLCDAATDTMGKLNLLGAFDSIFASAFPTTLAHCDVAMRLRFRRIEQGRHHLILHVVNEDGGLIFPPLEADLTVNIGPAERSVVANLILHLQNLRVETPGQYAVNLAIDGRQEASLPLTVRRASMNQPQKAVEGG